MRSHLIRKNINSSFNYFQENHLTIESENNEYITLIYKNNSVLNAFLNRAISNKLKISKSDNNIIIKVHSDILNNYNQYDIKEELNINISKLIKLVNVSNNLKISVNKDKEEYDIKIYTNIYKNILDNYAIGHANYYQVNINFIDDILKNIIEYNNLMEVSRIKIDNYIENFDFTDIKYYYNLEDSNKIIIINDGEKRKLIISGIVTISFCFSNNELFDRVFLPELLKLYVSRNNELSNEMITYQFNHLFYQVNNDLYILDFDDFLMTPNIEFLHNLINKKRYQININKDYVIYENIENDKKISTKASNKAYSYGYVNILLISFVLSLMTIIICLLKS